MYFFITVFSCDPIISLTQIMSNTGVLWSSPIWNQLEASTFGAPESHGACTDLQLTEICLVFFHLNQTCHRNVSLKFVLWNWTLSPKKHWNFKLEIWKLKLEIATCLSPFRAKQCQASDTPQLIKRKPSHRQSHTQSSIDQRHRNSESAGNMNLDYNFLTSTKNLETNSSS